MNLQQKVVKTCGTIILTLTLIRPTFADQNCTSNIYNQGTKFLFNVMDTAFNFYLPAEEQKNLYSLFNIKLDRVINDQMTAIFTISPNDVQQFPRSVQNILEMLIGTKIENETGILAKANRNLDRIRYQSSNPAMGDCFRIVVLKTEIEYGWAYNMGCTLYLTSGLIKMLNDDELTAVIAHEMSHGAEGHMAKSLLQYSQTTTTFFSTLIAEEFTSLFSSKLTTPCMSKYVTPFASGFSKEELHQLFISELDMFVEIHGATAPNTEIQADIEAVKVLKKIHISPNNLKYALLKLEGISESELKSDTGAADSFRDYPSFKERFAAIDKAASSVR